MRTSVEYSTRLPALLILAGSAGLLGCRPTDANPVVATNIRFEILSVESPTFEGMSFGDVGQYEKVFAKAHGEVDPSDPRNARITDIKLAPRNAKGMVEYSTDVHIIKPVNMAKANGRIFFTVANRGNKGIDTFNGAGGNNPTTVADAGTGMLMRRGYTMVWTGWEDERLRPPGDHRVLARFPVARNPDGSSVVGLTIYEHVFDTSQEMTFTLVRPGIRDGLKYRAASLDQSKTRLLVRNHSRFVGGPLVERVEVPTSMWSYVDDMTVRINRADPFLARYDAGAAYELIYPAKDPVVLGLGFATTRDVVSFLRHDASAANPLRGAIQYALATGSSQTGRYLRGFTYWGFNEDLAGRKVFEGILPRVAGAHGIALDDRFGDTDATSRSYERDLSSKMEFPFTYENRKDPVSGRTDGLFARCEVTRTCPNVMQMDGGNEAWLKAMNLLSTDGLGRDIALPDNVRLYFIASAPHGGGPPARPTDICQQLSNPNDSGPHIRALLIALDEWATRGVRPPESRHPKVSDGTFVPPLPQSAVGYPNIPGARYTGWHIPVAVKDKGGLPYRWIPGKEYVVLVPRTDADGNDVAGIRTVEVQVPVATYTGWALRRAPFAEGEDCGNTGQYIPFPATRAERVASGDPRLSVEERYPNRADYMSKVNQAVTRLVAERLVLEEEAETVEQAAAGRFGEVAARIGRN
jgi:hypothetical protein